MNTCQKRSIRTGMTANSRCCWAICSHSAPIGLNIPLARMPLTASVGRASRNPSETVVYDLTHSM